MGYRVVKTGVRKITCAGINLPSGDGWGTGLCRLESQKDYLCRNKPAIRGWVGYRIVKTGESERLPVQE